MATCEPESQRVALDASCPCAYFVDQMQASVWRATTCPARGPPTSHTLHQDLRRLPTAAAIRQAQGQPSRTAVQGQRTGGRITDQSRCPRVAEEDPTRRESGDESHPSVCVAQPGTGRVCRERGGSRCSGVMPASKYGLRRNVAVAGGMLLLDAIAPQSDRRITGDATASL